MEAKSLTFNAEGKEIFPLNIRAAGKNANA